MFHQTTNLDDEWLFNSLLSLKKSHDSLLTKEKSFLEYLEHSLGYLSDLATTMYEYKNIPYIYCPKEGNENIYARFFSENYNEKTFDSIEEFNDYRLGFHGAKELLNLKYDNEGNVHFSFRDKNILNYLYASNPCEIVNNRIKSIAERVTNNSVSVEPPRP